MTGFAWALGSLLAAAAYVLAGWHLAVRDLPAAWERSRDMWTCVENVEDGVRWQTVFMVLLWPVLWPVRRLRYLIRPVLDDVIRRGDPAEMARQVSDRDRRIAELEAELGIRGGAS